MEKLEIKHLACYLPYGLKLYYEYTNKIGQISNIYTIGEGYDTDDIKISIDYSEAEHIWMFKPILRPLSDLTDEIINEFYKGKAENKVIVSDYSLNEKIHTCTASYKMMGEPYTDFIYNRNSIETTDYWIVEKMLKMHYDVFGLIEKGLAIDINKLFEVYG